MKILGVSLIGYREWTESLGYDREWKIQIVQSSLVRSLMEVCHKVEAFPLPLRYDSFLVIVDGVSKDDILRIIDGIKMISPVRVKACLEYGKTPREAQEKASRCLNESSEDVVLREYKDENVVSVHFDLNGFTEISRKDSIYNTFIYMMDIYVKIAKFIYNLGGIIQYLGGDNILGFLNETNLEEILTLIKYNLKIGIGIAKTPVKAVSLAAEALDEIRRNRERLWLIKRSY
ncbi:MAG: GTP cyclohydrolase IIa [Sulfolobaceae archaeon]